MIIFFTFVMIFAFIGLMLWTFTKAHSDFEDEFFDEEEDLYLDKEEENDGISL